MTLLVAYALDEGTGTTAVEAGGGATITDVPDWAAGLSGSAIYINAEAGPSLDPFAVSTAFTIMFDVYVVGPGGNGVNILLNNPTIGNIQVVNASGALEWYLGPTPTSGTIANSVWKHVAITGDAVARKAYLDGSLVGTAGGGLSGTDPLVLGGFPSYFPNIRLDNLRVFDTVLTQAEIAALAGTPVTEPPPEEDPTLVELIDALASRAAVEVNALRTEIDAIPAGPQGAPGADGDSAYEVAVANGFVGTEAEWLDSLVGPQGEQGIQGVPGAPGDDGADGLGVILLEVGATTPPGGTPTGTIIYRKI